MTSAAPAIAPATAATTAATTALDAEEVVAAFRTAGFGPFTGVPCSFLGPVISCLERRHPDDYVIAANEGEAVAIAAGARLAGRRPVVILQNSGLGNAVNPLTSLCHTLRLPVLLLVTWRGEPGTPDEPQHELIGQITPGILTAMGIRHELLPDTGELLAERLRVAASHMDATGLPFAFVVPKGAVAPVPRTPQEPSGAGGPLLRSEAIGHVMRLVGDRALVVATTGKTARELERDRDRAGNLYVVGSMGCASSVALGVALHAPSKQVVVLDGDGAALMRLEAMATIGRTAPPNLLHIVFDNGAYESTGGQPTGSAHVDFAGVATACGYRHAADVTTAEGLGEALSRLPAGGGPALLRVRVAPYSDPGLGRPALPPPASAARFSAEVTA
ncbi:phosphonopyruvate decarboxylase [Streptomyces sp. SKN60]|uniref:phosphonopyruvate decarboxylase n=1 Tax=Streptomyces sp. SKN60 TaxID=2855506 RepID=UPI0022452794|nr:phosphonopyruvate decarboxylase [Streptomyces sp. SKN60]MCX2182006.1 phosphonopyruvate decarboxylase [Streptomyces sp. SKN60]